MRHRVSAILLMLAASIATAAEASDFEFNDYAALFAAYESQVRVVGPKQRALSLPNGIELIEHAYDGERIYTDSDNSGLGSVLCTTAWWLHLDAYAAICPGLFDADENKKIDDDLERLAAFIADNAFPPKPVGDVRAMFDKGTQVAVRHASATGGPPRTACLTMTYCGSSTFCLDPRATRV